MTEKKTVVKVTIGGDEYTLKSDRTTEYTRVVAEYVDRVAIGRWLLNQCERFRHQIAMLAIPFAVALGIYTGILLSAFGARPFWNSGVLGPLFLVSGMSTAAALVALIAREHLEKALFTRIDLGLIFVEIMLTGLSEFCEIMMYLLTY